MTIASYLEHDHRRLEAILAKAETPSGQIDIEVYEEFRQGLLSHIGMEENILFPATQKAHEGIVIERAAKLRLDHGALAALLVLTPDKKVIGAIRAILEPHNIIEEGPPGVYEECEKILGEDASRAILEKMQHVPPLPLAHRKQTEALLRAAKRCMERAGFAGSLLD